MDVESEIVRSAERSPPPERMPPLCTLRVCKTTAVPFCVIVPDALNAPFCKSWVEVAFAIESVEVPFSPPVVFAQYGKVNAVIAELVETEPLEPHAVAIIVPLASVLRHAAFVVEASRRFTAMVVVALKVVAALNVCAADQVTLDAAVTNPGLLNASVFAENVRFAPISAACKVPDASVLIMEEVTAVSSVDESKVVVALNVCNAVHVTLEAAVTKPGFTNA